MYVCMYVCTYVEMNAFRKGLCYVCMYVCVCVYAQLNVLLQSMCVYKPQVCMHAYTSTCTCISTQEQNTCKFTHTGIYIYIYTHTHSIKAWSNGITTLLQNSLKEFFSSCLPDPGLEVDTGMCIPTDPPGPGIPVEPGPVISFDPGPGIPEAPGLNVSVDAGSVMAGPTDWEDIDATSESVRPVCVAVYVCATCL
jgi:hypothetical protein